jgi:mannose-1-phosphate guanylyltransferase
VLKANSSDTGLWTLMWSDVGSWDSLFGVLPADENGNIVAVAVILASIPAAL